LSPRSGARGNAQPAPRPWATPSTIRKIAAAARCLPRHAHSIRASGAAPRPRYNSRDCERKQSRSLRPAPTSSAARCEPRHVLDDHHRRHHRRWTLSSAAVWPSTPQVPAIIISYALTGVPAPARHAHAGRDGGRDAAGCAPFTEFTRGRRSANWAGFSVGWLYWYFWVVVIPVEAIAGAGIIENWVPLPTWVIGTVLMALMTAVKPSCRPRAYGEFEFWFLVHQGSRPSSSFIIVVGGACLRLSFTDGGRPSRTLSLTVGSRRRAGSRCSPR